MGSWDILGSIPDASMYCSMPSSHCGVSRVWNRLLAVVALSAAVGCFDVSLQTGSIDGRIVGQIVYNSVRR